MVRAPQRKSLITVQRPQTVTDAYGQEIAGVPLDLQRAWARVRFGPAGEKREAAQESAVQAATFEVDPSKVLLGTELTDHILYDDSEWNITEVAPLDRHTLRFTAIRSR